MKTIKKMAGLLLAICLIVPCFSLLTHAANGKIMFTDPSTKVGETLQLKGVLEADAAIEDRTIVMKYDATMLKFKDGDHVTETSSGQITYKVEGEQSGQRVEFLMNFEVLKEGTTKVEVVSDEAYTTADAKITFQRGSSTIKIEAGDVVTSPTDTPTDVPSNQTLSVTINNISYTIINNFDQVEVPQGYAEGTVEYDTGEIKVLTNAKSGVQLACLADAEGNAELYMYLSEDATFAPFRDIAISDKVTIVVLSSREDVSLSERYTETVALIDGVEFPAWQNLEQTEMCLLYAINDKGEKSLYQFDTVEGTYQRFTEQETVAEEPNASEEGFMGMIQENLTEVLIGVGAAVLVLIIILIVISVKLYNRNAELDDLYDEYGIDLEDEEESEKENDKEEFFICLDEETEDDVIMEETDVTEEKSEEVTEEITDEEEEVELPEDTEPNEEEVDLAEEDADILAKLENIHEKTVKKPSLLLEDEDDDEDFDIHFIDIDD